MTYKNKQREADRERQRRYRRDANLRRDKQGVIGRDTKGVTKGMTNEGMTARSGTANVIPCRIDCVAPHSQCHTVKRGKDIKCFADLPEDVQQTIKKMSSDDGGVTWDKAEKDRRTAIAIHYQTTCFGAQAM